MSMLNDSNPSVDTLLAGFGNLSPEEKTVFLGKLAEGAEIKQKPQNRTVEELCGIWDGEENREDVDRMVQAIREGRKINPEDQKNVFESVKRKAGEKKRKTEISLDDICGAWSDDERSAEEIIREIYESRTFGRERPPLS